MTHTYAAKRLLEHGPLTASEFRKITGWPSRTVEATLRGLCRTEVAKRVGNPRRGGYTYGLA